MNETWQGMYIASAPNPVPNAVFMRQLRHAMRVRFGLSSPTFIVRAGSKLIFRTDPELALYGRYVKPRRLIEEGFSFKFPTIESALNDVCSK
jgi:NAD dependent epimerase/dehydratase family enzyme